MARSTSVQKGQRLNMAFKLIARGCTLNHAASALVKQFHISPRQAYRYLQKARHMETPMPIVDPAIPITIKIPSNTASKLYAHANTYGLTTSKIVRHAINAFFVESEKKHGKTL